MASTSAATANSSHHNHLRTLAQRHRQNGEILLSDLSPRASVLRRSSSTCANRTTGRQGCKSASDTQKPSLHHRGFSNAGAPHRQPVRLYNGLPGLQRQPLTPIKEVRPHFTPSHHRRCLALERQILLDRRSNRSWRPLFSPPYKITPNLPTPTGILRLSHHHLNPLRWPVLCCVLPVGDWRPELRSSRKYPFPSQKALPLPSPRHLPLSIALRRIVFSRGSIEPGAFPVGKRWQDFPCFHACGGYILLQKRFRHPLTSTTFPLPHAHLAPSRRSFWTFRIPSGEPASRLISCPTLVRRFALASTISPLPQAYRATFGHEPTGIEDQASFHRFCSLLAIIPRTTASTLKPPPQLSQNSLADLSSDQSSSARRLDDLYHTATIRKELN